jgi:hypothetical protein
MLADYESCRRTGMNVAEISGELYRCTSGYPFLVSKLCKLIDERLGRDWSLEGVALAVKALLRDKNTLFDDMFKNIENNQRLYRLIFDFPAALMGAKQLCAATGEGSGEPVQRRRAVPGVAQHGAAHLVGEIQVRAAFAPYAAVSPGPPVSLGSSEAPGASGASGSATPSTPALMANASNSLR